MSVAEIGTRLAAGDDRAVADCYAALGPYVLSYARRYVPESDAEDVVQRTFVEVWRSAARFDPGRSLEAWVFGIARRRAIDVLRSRRSTVVPVEDLRELVGDDGRESAERYAWAVEVRRALDRLPKEQRTVIERAYFGERTQREISDEMGIPLGTVKARTARGMARLATMIDMEAGAR